MHSGVCSFIVIGLMSTCVLAEGPSPAELRALTIGYNEYRTDLATGDACDQSTVVCFINADGSGRQVVEHGLKADEFTAVTFQGWTPDGAAARLTVLRTSPEATALAEKQQNYPAEGLKYEQYLFDPVTNRATPAPPPEVPKSRYTEGVHGYALSPDRQRICFANGVLGIASVDGSEGRNVATNHPFNFIPLWSPDGKWIAVLAGVHPIFDVVLVAADRSSVRDLGLRHGYEGFTTRWDVYHFHNGDSDLHAWSPDGKWIYYSAKFGEAVDLVRVNLDGQVERLTFSDESQRFQHPVLRPGGGTETGVRNSHPSVSPDGKWLAFTSTRTGRRQICVMQSSGGDSVQITNVEPGWGARHAHWRPARQ